MSAGTRGYNDRRWRRVRARFLREHPHCACGCGQPAEVVHHLDRLGLSGPLAYEPANLQGLTVPCHNRITAKDQAKARPSRRRSPERHPGLI